MSRPSGLSVSRDTHAVRRPSRARATAVFSSAPPTCTSRLRACSSRRKPGGLRRIIASPKVITSGIHLPFGQARPRFPDDLYILARQGTHPIEFAHGDRLRLDELAAHSETG